MPLQRLRQLNASTVGGLNTLTNPPPPSARRYSPTGTPLVKRQKLEIASSSPKDSVHSRCFIDADRQDTTDAHDLARSGSHEDLYDFKSNSSTGKSRGLRAGVEEYRSIHPKSNATKSRVRKSRALGAPHQVLKGSRKGEDHNFESPYHFKSSESFESTKPFGNPSPPLTNIRSDIIDTGLKRSRSIYQTETTSPHFKRPRHHQSLESIDSEDELSRDQCGKERLATFSGLVAPKRQSSKADIQPTQFLKPLPQAKKISSAPVHERLPNLKIISAVSGKHIYAEAGGDGELILQQMKTGSSLLIPKCMTNAKCSHSWMTIDLDKLTSIEHGSKKNHLVHITRPRSYNSGDSLWLKFMDHNDVLSLVSSAKCQKSMLLPDDTLEVKWQKAYDAAATFRLRNPMRASPSALSNIQDCEVGTNNKRLETDKNNTAAMTRRPVKLVEQMQASAQSAGKVTCGVTEDEVSNTGKASGTRRTRSSFLFSSPRKASPERWTDDNPDWRGRWHHSPLVFPSTGKNRATVDVDDILRLDEGEFLNDNLISFYIRYLQATLECKQPELLQKVYFFSTFFFEKLRSIKGKINYDGVRAWTAKVDLFSYDYIVVPVNEHAHWYLAIICNAPDAFQVLSQDNRGKIGNSADGLPSIATGIERDMSDVTIQDVDMTKSAGVEIPNSSSSHTRSSQNSSPSLRKISPTRCDNQSGSAGACQDELKALRIITLDSLANPHPSTCKALREYLIAEAKDKKGVDLVKAVNGMTAKKIPEQDNFCDCGVFVLGYMEEFLKAPDETIRKLIQREPLEWDIRPSQLRISIRNLLFELQQQQHERHLIEKEEKKRLLAAKKQAVAGGVGSSAPNTFLDSFSSSETKEAVTALTGSSGTGLISKAAPTHIDTVVENGAQSFEEENISPLPSKRRSDDAVSLIRVPKDVNDMSANKRTAGDMRRSTSPSIRSPRKRNLADAESRGASFNIPSLSRDVKQQNLVETLSISSPEVEVQKARPACKINKRSSFEFASIDVEEVMAISSSRATRRNSKRLVSAPPLIQTLRSSQSLSPKQPTAKYDGIERSVDLT